MEDTFKKAIEVDLEKLQKGLNRYSNEMITDISMNIIKIVFASKDIEFANGNLAKVVEAGGDELGSELVQALDIWEKRKISHEVTDSQVKNAIEIMYKVLKWVDLEVKEYLYPSRVTEDDGESSKPTKKISDIPKPTKTSYTPADIAADIKKDKAAPKSVSVKNVSTSEEVKPVEAHTTLRAAESFTITPAGGVN